MGTGDAAGGSWAPTAAAEVVLSSELLCSQRVSVLAHLPHLVSAYSVQTQTIVQEFFKSKQASWNPVFCAGHGKRFGVVTVGSWEGAGGFVLACLFWDRVLDNELIQIACIVSRGLQLFAAEWIKILQNTSSISIQLLKNLGHCFIHLAEQLTYTCRPFKEMG